MQKTRSNTNHFTDNLENFGKHIFQLFKEIYYGFKSGTIDWFIIGLWVFLANAWVFLGLDILIVDKIGFLNYYLNHPVVFWTSYGLILSFGFIAWAEKRFFLKKKLSKILTNTFINAKLKSPSGKIPNFIGDYPIDTHTRKLLITSEGIPLTTFRAQKEYLESNLSVYIDEIKEKRENGTISITYSHIAMPEHISHKDVEQCRNFNYFVGMTRAKSITENFRKSPHLLIAGQTGGGKSTMLRHLITNLYTNHEKASFKLIDLKEGLEFQIFDNLKRVEVIDGMDKVISNLNVINDKLNERMDILKNANCKDIDAYQNKMASEKTKDTSSGEKKVSLHREFIVIDEAAEIFLGGPHAKMEDTQLSRKILSRVARLGRACGMHLIIATQRPDVKALDSQVKANLTSIISFPMPNLASSMTVLGNGRASELPPIPGRAVWKSGSRMVEVQTPLMTEKDALEILQPHKLPEKPNKKELLSIVTDEAYDMDK